MKLLIYARSFGGNYLLNIGPAPDGTMRAGYYKECQKIADWMKNNKESVIGTEAVPKWKEMSELPLTKNGKDLYIHLLKNKTDFTIVKKIPEPKKAILLENGKSLDFKVYKDEIKINLPQNLKDFSVVKLIY
jgi:alpha-L-fucosidase